MMQLAGKTDIELPLEWSDSTLMRVVGLINFQFNRSNDLVLIFRPPNMMEIVMLLDSQFL